MPGSRSIVAPLHFMSRSKEPPLPTFSDYTIVKKTNSDDPWPAKGFAEVVEIFIEGPNK